MPFVKKRERSPSSTPVPSTEANAAQLPDREWEGMTRVLNYIYDYRTEDGFDPSKLFHRKVNKRVIPEYYDTIKEPIALSTIKQKLAQKTYTSFTDFVRDFALISHNAQVFNRADSGAFQDALVIKEQLQLQLQKLVAEGVITEEVATLPDLGEIPTYEDVPMEDGAVDAEAESEEASEDEGEEDDEDEDIDEATGRRKRGRPRGRTSIAKRELEGDDEGKRTKARPPKLFTPMESRITAVLKGIRKPKNQRGQLMIKSFDRLPDKQALPDYYLEIKSPMAYDVLKRKVKRKKYRSLEEFMADVNLMFDNAKSYNQDDSPIFRDAVALQVHAGKLYDEQRAIPDSEFTDEDGKLPLPNGILHNGELYKVGDWVHIQNPNDLTKPIPSQIYRTYKSAKGENMVNVCWYYRPEQTVHRFDKHFLANEVVKTGRYRDHHIEEIEGRCFIMFTTRYFKGRPRGLPEGTEIYVCEARYNEAVHQFNRIKTWASCQPDEVRDKDYEMDLFDHSRKLKKYPSPIAYMLKDEQKETDDLPKVTWGAEGAPPKIGAVHRRPRGERDSPPPEPTPPPAPRPAPIVRQPSIQQSTYGQSPAQPEQRPPSTQPRPTTYGASHPQSYNQPIASPAPQRPPSTQGYSQPSPATPQTVPQPRPTVPTTSSYSSQPTTLAANAPTSYGGATQSSTPSVPPNPSTFAPRPAASSYRDPPPIEVYILPDQANLSIPPEVREQYQKDENGRVLFFTAPPVATEDTGLRGHSVRYLAAKARHQMELEKKRNQLELQREAEARVAKKARLDSATQTMSDVDELKRRALRELEAQLTIESLELDDADLRRLGAAQKAAEEQRRAMAMHDKMRVESRRIQLGGQVFGDDWDARVS